MAYAVVVSLKQTLEPLLDSARSIIQIPNSDLKLIYDDLCYLKSFFDKVNSLQDSISVDQWEEQIKDVVQKAQDLIESHISDLFHSGSESSRDESSNSEFSRALLEVKDKLGSITKMLKGSTGEQQSPGSLPVGAAVSSKKDFSRNNKTVGLDDERIMLLDWITGYGGARKMIPIVGMPGIGKTALARSVFQNSLIQQHFDICLFVEIGLEYKLKESLLGMLGQMGFNKDTTGKNDDKLRGYVHNFLIGRRYLLILDDIWDTRALSELIRILPDNSNGSRVIMTTRLTNVVRGAWYQNTILQKRFLNDEESWNLLCDIVFSEESCPFELEDIGRTISKKLGGLPLAVVEIGKLLSDSGPTVESWMAVADKVNSLLQESSITNIVKPSYAQLPPHLKACFLYLGVFPPNFDIHTSQLINLWVAEGFIESAAYQSSEEKAEEYLEDLVSRSLVMVHKRCFRGRIKTCRIHFVFHHLCVCEAWQEKIFHVLNESTISSPHGTKNQRRLGIHNSAVLGFKQVHKLMKSVSAARSLLCVGPHHQHPLHLELYLGFRCLRVLHALPIGFGKFPDQVLKLVRLRYLAITYDGELPPSIFRLWNLEVLIIRPSQSIKSSVFLPLEIWKLHKLRHLECMGFDLPDPSGESLFLENLLTLSGVSVHSCTMGVLAKMPKLMKLGIWLEPTYHAVENFCSDAVFIHLHHLRSFKCVVMNLGVPSQAASSLTVFPTSLTKLNLSGCGFPWELMTSISNLPCLEVLKLRWCAFCGPQWEVYEGGFCQLKFLLLEDLDIEHWTVESHYFPRLQRLLIRRCYKLQEILGEFGDIPTLEVIEVDECNVSLAISAMRMLVEQEDLGNEGLTLDVIFNGDGELTSFNKMLEEEGLASNNLRRSSHI